MQFLNDFLSDTIILIRPLLGSLNSCKFTISCTDYAAMELRKNSFNRAVKNIICRLVNCWFGK